MPHNNGTFKLTKNKIGNQQITYLKLQKENQTISINNNQLNTLLSNVYILKKGYQNFFRTKRKNPLQHNNTKKWINGEIAT